MLAGQRMLDITERWVGRRGGIGETQPFGEAGVIRADLYEPELGFLAERFEVVHA